MGIRELALPGLGLASLRSLPGFCTRVVIHAADRHLNAGRCITSAFAMFCGRRPDNTSAI
jgi:hypothetical protein